MRSLAAVIVFMVTAGCASTPYDVRKNLEYDSAAVAPFGTFDLYTPKGKRGPYPTLFFIHGGAWMVGDKADAKVYAETFCPTGYAVVSVNYRLSSDGPWGKGSVWPAQLLDCQAALRYVREHAGIFGLDGGHIAAIGVSAGGHLATALCLRDEPGGGRAAIGVDLDGEQNVALGDKCMFDYTNIMSHVLGHAPPFSAAELATISNVQRVRRDVSLFIVHGEFDSNVYVVNSDELSAGLHDAGADTMYYRPALECHGDCWLDPSVLPALRVWLDKRLK